MLLIRHLLVVVLSFAPALMIALPQAAVAQDAEAQPSNVELYEQGMAAYEQGQYRKARQRFRQLDPMQLPKKQQRVKLFETLQAIDRKLNPEAAEQATPDQPAGEPSEPEAEGDQPAQPEPAEGQADGQPQPEGEAEADGQPEAAADQPTPQDWLAQARTAADVDPDEAATLYQKVIDSDAASEAVRRKAEAELAQLRRMENPDRFDTQARISEAEQAIDQGNYRQAKRHLDAIKQADVELGWFDQQKIKRQRQMIQQNLAPQLAKKQEPSQPQMANEADQPTEQAGEPDQPAVDMPDQPEPAEQADQPTEAEPSEPADQPDQPELAQADQPDEAEQADQPDQPQQPAEPAEPTEPTEADEPTLAQGDDQQPAQPAAGGEQMAEPAGEPDRPEDAFKNAYQFYISKYVDEAETAMQKEQFDLAVNRYEQALSFAEKADSDRASRIQNKLNAAKAARAEAGGEQGLLPGQGELSGARRQQIIARYNEYRDAAKRARNSLNYAKAQEQIRQAKIVLQQPGHKELLGSETYQRLLSQANQLAAGISDDKAAFEKFQQQQAEQAARIEEMMARRRQKRREQQEIQKLLKEAQQLQRDMKYAQALERVNQALAIDETNIAAQAMQDLIEQGKIVKQTREYERQKDLGVARMNMLNEQALIPSDQIVEYPENWPQLSEIRMQSQRGDGGGSEVNRQVRQALRQPVPIDFENRDLSTVINYLRNTTDVNFFVNWAALEDAGVARDTLVSLQLTNVPAEQALDLTLEQAGARSFEPVDWAIIDGVVRISSQRDLETSTATRVYDIRDLLVQVPNFSNAPNFDLRSALAGGTGGQGGGGVGGGGGIGGGGGVGGGGGGGLFGQQDDGDEAEEPTRQEIIQEITGLIQDTVGDPQDWGPGASSSLRELNGNLIVRTTNDNHRQVQRVLSQLRDTRAVQISVQARFLMVSDDFLEDIGVDFDLQFNPSSAKWGPINLSQDSTSLASPSSGSGSPASQFTEGAAGIGPAQDFEQGLGLVNQSTDADGNVVNENTGRAFDIGASFQDNLSANLLVKATQADERSMSLTAPRVTFFNGQRAFVIVARQETFTSDLEPVPDAIGFDPTLSVIQEGVVLDVEGTVSADRRYVTLTLRPSLAEITSIDQSEVASASLVDDLGDDGDTDGGEDTADSQFSENTQVIEQPELELTSVRATVSIPDRGTLLIGGQRVVDEIEREVGVPVLSKVPFVNRLFTNTSTVKDQRTLLILIKPRIIIQSEEENQRFPEMRNFGPGG